jgi:hypothetical protein
MGKVSLGGQWLGITLFLAGFIGWSHFRRLWPRRKVAPGHVPDDTAVSR